MTPSPNQDESETPKSRTASASKSESADGRWLPPALDRLPALTAVFASWSLVVSVAYDWGFFSALGISFARAPTTLSDHLSSWLVWATLYTPIPVAYVIYLMIRFHRQVRADLKENEGDDEVPSTVQLIFRRMRLFYRIIFWIFPVLFLSWLLFGTPKIPWGWIALSWIGLVGLLEADLRNLPEEVTARARSAMRSISLPLLLVTWVPATFFVFFAFGYAYLDRAQDDAMPRAFVRVGAGDLDSGSVAEATYVLRSFANWLLVQDEDRTQVNWVRVEHVDRIEVHPDVRFPGLLCAIFGRWCRGDSGVFSASSLPEGAHAEPHEPTSAIDLKAGTPVGIGRQRPLSRRGGDDTSIHAHLMTPHRTRVLAWAAPLADEIGATARGSALRSHERPPFQRGSSGNSAFATAVREQVSPGVPPEGG